MAKIKIKKKKNIDVVKDSNNILFIVSMKSTLQQGERLEELLSFIQNENKKVASIIVILSGYLHRHHFGISINVDESKAEERETTYIKKLDDAWLGANKSIIESSNYEFGRDIIKIHHWQNIITENQSIFEENISNLKNLYHNDEKFNQLVDNIVMDKTHEYLKTETITTKEDDIKGKMFEYCIEEIAFTMMLASKNVKISEETISFDCQLYPRGRNRAMEYVWGKYKLELPWISYFICNKDLKHEPEQKDITDIPVEEASKQYPNGYTNLSIWSSDNDTKKESIRLMHLGHRLIFLGYKNNNNPNKKEEFIEKLSSLIEEYEHYTSSPQEEIPQSNFPRLCI